MARTSVMEGGEAEALTRLFGLADADRTWLGEGMRQAADDVALLRPRIQAMIDREAALLGIAGLLGVPGAGGVTMGAVSAAIERAQEQGRREAEGVIDRDAEGALALLDDYAHRMIAASCPAYQGHDASWEEGARHGWTHAMAMVRSVLRQVWPGVDGAIVDARARPTDDPRSMWPKGTATLARAASRAMAEAGTGDEWFGGHGGGVHAMVEGRRVDVATCASVADARLVVTAVNWFRITFRGR